MRPSRSSPILRRQSSGSTDADGAYDASTKGGGKKGCGPGLSGSRSKTLSPDIPPWAATEVFRAARSPSGTRRRPEQSDSLSAGPCLGAAESQEGPRPSGQHAPPSRAHRLEPLLTFGEAAAILNVSERTVRRLVASGAVPAVSIGRSVRIRPRDVGRLIADGGVCND
jgi:excisionase family DNA binding protein